VPAARGWPPALARAGPRAPSPLRVRGPLSSFGFLSVPTVRPRISFFFDIAQGAGLASATGVRPFLPPLLAGALARGDLGIDFDGTGYAFLESPAFLAAILALAVGAYALERARGSAADRGRLKSTGASGGEPRLRDPLTLALSALAVALGALLFAGSLAAADAEEWPGLLAGAACALLGVVAVGGLLGRVRRRLAASAAGLLPVWADAAALGLAAVAVLFPPAALLGIAALVYLLVTARRTGAQKYEGLRILR
jgi:hypothetical protein